MPWYETVKFIHVSCVVLSISGFAFRGFLKLRNSLILNQKIVKVLPHVVDTLLLVSAIILVVISAMYPWQFAWVGMKIVALIAYILAGSFLMRGEAGRASQYGWYALSLLIAGYIVLLALSKSPSLGY